MKADGAADVEVAEDVDATVQAFEWSSALWAGGGRLAGAGVVCSSARARSDEKRV